VDGAGREEAAEMSGLSLRSCDYACHSTNSQPNRKPASKPGSGALTAKKLPASKPNTASSERSGRFVIGWEIRWSIL
jgi:hypothetical protein